MIEEDRPERNRHHEKEQPVTAPDTLSAFYFALEESPGDPLTLQALADWFDEQGNAASAACLRWAVRTKRTPFHFERTGPLTVVGNEWHDGWYWWVKEHPQAGADWGYPAECQLLSRLWKHLRHSFDYTPSVFKEYPSVRAAYEALLAAWPLAQPVESVERRRGRRS